MKACNVSEAAILFRKFEIEAKDGRKWALPRPTLAVEREYATYMEKKDARSIERNRLELGPIGYGESLRQWRSDCTNSHWGWLRKGFWDSLESPENTAHWVLYWVNRNHPQDADRLHIASEGDAYRLYMDNKEAWDKALGESFNDPNPLPPE